MASCVTLGKLVTKLEHYFLVSVNKVIVTYNVLEFLKLHQIPVTLSL